MNWRDLVGWRFLKGDRRAALKFHTNRVERLFVAFEEDGDDPTILLGEPLERLRGGSVLQALHPDLVASAVVASAGILRKFPLKDRRTQVWLLAPPSYRRHFAAERIIEYGSKVPLPYSASDVALLFDLALTSGNIDRSLHDVQIRFGSDWDQFAAAHVVDQILAEVRIPLFNAALSGAEGLMSIEFSGDVAEQLVRSRDRLERVKPATFEVTETLERIDALLGRPLNDAD